MSEINMLGMLDIKGKEQIRRVYGIDGIAPTLTAVQGGGHHAKILEKGAEGMRTVRVNDLFCGAGGMGLGFKNAGFEISGAWDFDKYAVQSYGHNVGDHVKQADISQMTFEDMPAADVWTFGFPCQDLSIAGKQAGLFEGKRSGLFFEVMRLLDETAEHAPENLPAVIMAENVKGLKPYLEVLKEEYSQRGYKMFYTLYNSKFWGVPQNRERYFVVGIHESIEKEFEFPIQQEKYIPRLSTVLEQVVDEKYYIDDLKALKIIEQAKEGLRVKQATRQGYDVAVAGDAINVSNPNSKTRRGRVGKQVAQTLLTQQEQVVVEGLKDVHAVITPDRVEKRQNGRRAKDNEEEMFTLTAQDRHGVITAEQVQHEVFETKDGAALACTANYQKGLSYLDIKSKRKTHVVEEIQKSSGLLDPNKEGRCLRVGGKGSLSAKHNYEHFVTNDFRVRKLTPREYGRLQGFPETFEFVVSDSQLYKQFGNAVSVPVAQAIAERIRMFLLSL